MVRRQFVDLRLGKSVCDNDLTAFCYNTVWLQVVFSQYMNIDILEEGDDAVCTYAEGQWNP
jgi:hypothetical protein